MYTIWPAGLTPEYREVGAVGLKSLKRSLDEGEENRTRAKESLGKRTASRSIKSVRAIAKPVIALLENLVTQASEEKEVEDAETSKCEEMAAFAKCASVYPRPARNLLDSEETRKTERAIPRNEALRQERRTSNSNLHRWSGKRKRRKKDDPNRNCRTRNTTQRPSTRPLNAVR